MTINWDFFKLAGGLLGIPLVFVILILCPAWLFFTILGLAFLTFIYFLIAEEVGHPFRKARR